MQTRRLVVISTLVVIHDNRMLLVRKEGADSFILPGGKPESGETLEEAVRREVLEELGCEILNMTYIGQFQDEAADAPGVDVLVHVHVGRLSSSPRVQAEIRELVWCDLGTPEVPVAPSLKRQIFGYFRAAAAVNAQLAAVVKDLRKLVTITEYSDRHVTESLVQAELALGEIAPDEVPMRRIFMPLHEHHARNLKKKRHEMERLDQSIERERRSAEREKDLDPRANAKEMEAGARYRQNQVDQRAQIERDLAVGEGVARRLKEDPQSLLLPLGTAVITRTPSMMKGDWPLPVGGSHGVVVGYSTLFNRPNIIAFPQNVTETDGGKVPFDQDEANRYHQVNYLPEELEVIAPGELVDGTPIGRPGWWPTHSHHEKGSALYSESMVVRGAGRLWRIQPCSGLPECTQITVDTEDGRRNFDHLIPLV